MKTYRNGQWHEGEEDTGNTALERIPTNSLGVVQHQPLPESPGLLDRLRSKFSSNIQQKILGDQSQTLEARKNVLKVETGAVQQGTELIRAATEAERANFERKQVPKEALLKEGELDIGQGEQQLKRIELELRQMHLLQYGLLEEDLKRKRAELEIAKIDYEIKAMTSAPQLPKDERAEKRAYWNGELERLKQDKTRAVSTARGEEERVEVENMFDDKIHNAREHLSEYL